jgi:hypothetical protein
MSQAAKFKVTLEFEIDMNTISVPDVDTFEKLRAPPPSKQKKMDEKSLRAAMKTKGMTDADIEKALAGAGKAGAKGATGKAPGKGKTKRDPQMLLYPGYENWAAAQQTLQQEILKDDALAATYVREVVRDLTRGRIEALIESKFGVPDLNGAIVQAMQRLSPADKATLKSDQESLVHDESELVDDSVDCQFTDMTVTRM